LDEAKQVQIFYLEILVGADLLAHVGIPDHGSDGAKEDLKVKQVEHDLVHASLHHRLLEAGLVRVFHHFRVITRVNYSSDNIFSIFEL
jgi:hypothetical protein